MSVSVGYSCPSVDPFAPSEVSPRLIAYAATKEPQWGVHDVVVRARRVGWLMVDGDIANKAAVILPCKDVVHTFLSAKRRSGSEYH